MKTISSLDKERETAYLDHLGNTEASCSQMHGSVNKLISDLVFAINGDVTLAQSTSLDLIKQIQKEIGTYSSQHSEKATAMTDRVKTDAQKIKTNLTEIEDAVQSTSEIMDRIISDQQQTCAQLADRDNSLKTHLNDQADKNDKIADQMEHTFTQIIRDYREQM